MLTQNIQQYIQYAKLVQIRLAGIWSMWNSQVIDWSYSIRIHREKKIKKNILSLMTWSNSVFSIITLKFKCCYLFDPLFIKHLSSYPWNCLILEKKIILKYDCVFTRSDQNINHYFLPVWKLPVWKLAAFCLVILSEFPKNVKISISLSNVRN